MLTTLDVVLRAAPAVMALEQSTNAVSSFLGPPPSLWLREACTFGSLALLDWIWSSSCLSPATRTPWWALHNFLRSDRNYHRWQFSRSLEVALTRGDVAMVEWIFAHFSGCEAPWTVADRAIGSGNLRALWSLRELANPQGAEGQGRGCTVQLGRRVWNNTTIRKACENGQLSQCLDDGMELAANERQTAIKCAVELGNTSLAERFLPAGRCLLDYGAGCPRLEMIQWMLDCGYLQRDERLAASAIPGLAASGRLDLIQNVLELHSPLSPGHEDWVVYWIEAIKEACSSGKDVTLKWLLDAPVGIEASDRMRSGKMTKPFLVAAQRGHAEVMETLHGHQLAGDVGLAMDYAVESGQVNAVKWLVDHCPGEDLKRRRGIDKAAEHGHVEVLQLFHDFDAAASGFEAAEAKRRKTNSWWSHARDPIYWAARNGHLSVLEWIQANRSQPCGADAMDNAAGQGHLEAVKWLHANRSEGCTRDAMNLAAINGHLEVLKWLHANRSEGCSNRAMYSAAEHGHLDVIKWLYTHRPDSHTPWAIDRAVRSGRVRVVCWLQPLFPDYKIGSALEPHKSLVNVNGASDCGETLEMVLCLHVCYGYVFTSRFLETLRTDLSWTRRHDPHLFRDVESWVDEHYPTEGS
jgi:hypothetical protein